MQEIVTGLARAAIGTALGYPVDFNLENALETYPWLRKKGAAFVTLNQRNSGQLRGCIGSLQAYRPLYEDIIANAQAAALRDPRFPPLRPEALEEVTIEVSILSEPKPLAYQDVEDLRRKIVPMRDGIVLRYGGYQATYLPQVWEQLPDFDAFFSSLCMKAGLPCDCLFQHPDIEVYHVESYQEPS